MMVNSLVIDAIKYHQGIAAMAFRKCQGPQQDMAPTSGIQEWHTIKEPQQWAVSNSRPSKVGLEVIQFPVLEVIP